MIIATLLVFAPAVKAVYPGWYMTGHIVANAALVGGLS